MKQFVRTVALMLVLSAPLAAQEPVRPPTDRIRESVPPAGAMPTLLQDIGLDQKLNERLPLSLQFTDENGRTVQLGDYFGKRPVILALVYYECPMLCTQVLNGLVSAIGVLNFSVGQEFDVVAVSFDPGETPELARGKKAAYVDRYKRPGSEAGWHFLTGTQHSITQLTRAVGFRYLQRGRGPVRPRERDHGGDAGGDVVALLLWHRVRPARPAAGAHRGRRSQDRQPGRPAVAGLLSLRPEERQVQPGGHAVRAGRRPADGGRDRAGHLLAAASGPTGPDGARRARLSGTARDRSD
jgi:cytochrome oxidase Cu insertion factor (SCO1/SenC/PrrC family)